MWIFIPKEHQQKRSKDIEGGGMLDIEEVKGVNLPAFFKCFNPNNCPQGLSKDKWILN